MPFKLCHSRRFLQAYIKIWTDIVHAKTKWPDFPYMKIVLSIPSSISNAICTQFYSMLCKGLVLSARSEGPLSDPTFANILHGADKGGVSRPIWSFYH